MAKRKSNGFGKVITALFIVVCLAVNFSYFIGIKAFGKEKSFSNSYFVDLQQAKDGAERYAIELNYFSNKKYNGLEMFEVKFNYLVDEDKTALYSQGLQFVANNGLLPIGFEYKRDETRKQEYIDKTYSWYRGRWNYALWGTMLPNANTKIHDYSSDDGFETPGITSPAPLNKQTEIKLQIGNDIFKLSLKGTNTPREDLSYHYSKEDKYHTYGVFGYRENHHYYKYYDWNYLAYLLFNAVKDMPAGTSDTIMMRFADMFDYQIYQNGQYVAVDPNGIESMQKKVFNYYKVKVNISEDGARKAQTDSIFKMIQGSAAYNTTGDYSTNDYFYGRTVINVSLVDFDLVYVYDDKHVALKLKEDFINYRLPSKAEIVLVVKIDLDALEKMNLTFFDFSEDNGLSKFNIEKCVTTQTVDGKLVETEVEYA